MNRSAVISVLKHNNYVPSSLAPVGIYQTGEDLYVMLDLRRQNMWSCAGSNIGSSASTIRDVLSVVAGRKPSLVESMTHTNPGRG